MKTESRVPRLVTRYSGFQLVSRIQHSASSRSLSMNRPAARKNQANPTIQQRDYVSEIFYGYGCGAADAGRHQSRHAVVYFALYGKNTKIPYKQSRHNAVRQISNLFSLAITCHTRHFPRHFPRHLTVAAVEYVGYIISLNISDTESRY